MLEEEDHQVGGGGGGVEAEVEVLQGLLLCLMCRNDHCLGYVITSHWFVVHVCPGHVLGMCCLYFGVLSCDRDMRNFVNSCIMMQILCLCIIWIFLHLLSLNIVHTYFLQILCLYIICKVKKIGANVQLQLKIRAVMQLTCWGHFCLFSLYLTPLNLLHGTGASGTFRFKKQGQTCKVKKNRGKRAITAQNKGSIAIDPKQNSVLFLCQCLMLFFLLTLFLW